jgi:replicative DNA helicase
MPKKTNKSKAGSDKLLEAHLAEQLGDGSARTSNADLEAKVIGAAFKRPSELQSIVSYLTADDFSDPRNKVFFNYIHDCYRSGKYPDAEVCIANALRNPDYEIEPEHYKDAMARCMEGDNSLDIQSACGVIHDLYVVRNLLGLAKRIEANVAQGKSSSDIVAQAETIFKTLSTDLYADDTLKDIDQLVDGLKGGWDEFLNPSVKAIPSPWSDLNGYIGGWKPGYFYIVGARPGVGKSVFLAQSAYHAALYDPSFKIAVFSHEMDGLDIWQRILCAQVGVLSDDFNQSSLSQSDKDRLTEYYQRSARRNIYISDKGGKTPLSLRSEVARFKAKHGRIDLVLIDYIQLMHVPGSKASERTQEVGSISRAIKSMSMEFNVPIIAAAQLNREFVKVGKDNRPSLADLRESGSLEQDPDVVIFPHRPSMNWTKPTPAPDDLFIIAKQRRGRTGDVVVEYKGSNYMFVQKM